MRNFIAVCCFVVLSVTCCGWIYSARQTRVLRLELTDVERRLSTEQTGLLEAQHQFSIAQLKLVAMKTQEKAIEESRDSVSQQRDEVTAQLRIRSDELTEANKQHDQMSSDFSKSLSKAKWLMNENSELLKRTIDLQDEKGAVTAERDQLATRLVSLTGLLADIQKLFDEKNPKIAKLYSDVKDTKTKVEDEIKAANQLAGENEKQRDTAQAALKALEGRVVTVQFIHGADGSHKITRSFRVTDTGRVVSVDFNRDGCDGEPGYKLEGDDMVDVAYIDLN